MASMNSSNYSLIRSTTGSCKESDDISYFEWDESSPSSELSTPSTSISSSGTQFSTWSKKLFSTPQNIGGEFSPASTPPTTPYVSPTPADKIERKIKKNENDEGRDYIPFLSTHSSIFAKWKQAKIVEEVDLSFLTTTVTPHLPEASVEQMFCCEECTTSDDEDFSFLCTAILPRSIEDSEVLQQDIDHLIEVLQVSPHQPEPYSPDPFASPADFDIEDPTATHKHYFAFSKTTRKYQAIDFEFFAAVASGFESHTIYASFKCKKHNQTFSLIKYRPSPLSLFEEEEAISNTTGLGIIFDTFPDLPPPIATAILERRVEEDEEEELSIQAFGTMKHELSPSQIAQERRRMVKRKKTYEVGLSAYGNVKARENEFVFHSE